MLSVKPQEVDTRKQIGNIDGSPVYQIGLKGGLFIIARVKGAGLDIMASGPHPTVAKHIAKKLFAHLNITELLKSEEMPEANFARLVPYYMDLTRQLNKLANG
jgi:hypothetical protein